MPDLPPDHLDAEDLVDAPSEPTPEPSFKLASRPVGRKPEQAPSCLSYRPGLSRFRIGGRKSTLPDKPGWGSASMQRATRARFARTRAAYRRQRKLHPPAPAPVETTAVE